MERRKDRKNKNKHELEFRLVNRAINIDYSSRMGTSILCFVCVRVCVFFLKKDGYDWTKQTECESG